MHKVRAVFSKPICANKARIGPPSANQDISTDSHNSHHVQPSCHVTLGVTASAFPCSTLSADTEPAHRDYLFCALRSMTSTKVDIRN